MAFTTTWSFGFGFQGYTFEEVIVLGSGSATREYITGAIRVRIVVDSAPPTNRHVQAFNTSSELNIPTEAGDSIAVDISATSDAVNMSTRLKAIYSDETSDETVSSNNNNARTVTTSLTAGKTLDFIEVRFSNQTNTGAIDHTRDILEIRLITQSAVVATAGILRSPSVFIEDNGGAGGNPASLSADVLNVYIAAFNNLGFPTLVKIAASLASDGSVVFEPMAGSRIGVQCGLFGADLLWIAGQFDSTNTVEKSDDAGSSFTAKNDAAIGSVRTFQVGPDADTKVIVFDEDNGDILETKDDGATWTTTNAAVTPVPNTIARFDRNLEEIVIGNQGGATDSIDYSPNTGTNLEDFQTGVYPNADATKVLAN